MGLCLDPEETNGISMEVRRESVVFHSMGDYPVTEKEQTIFGHGPSVEIEKNHLLKILEYFDNQEKRQRYLGAAIVTPPPQPAAGQLVKGTRVRWSVGYLATHTGIKGRQKVAAFAARGTVTGPSKLPNCVRVKWDHLASPATISVALLDSV